MAKSSYIKVFKSLYLGARLSMSNVARRIHSKIRNAYKVIEIDGQLLLENCGHKYYLSGSYDIDEKSSEHFSSLKAGDIVVTYKKPTKRKVAIARVIGHETDPGIESLISAHEVGVKMQFTKAAIREVRALSVPGIDDIKSGIKREDLRDVPLVTIDPDKAGDFDDAIFAEKITEENFKKIQKIVRRTKDLDGNPIKKKDVIGGFYVLSAIADVAHYVRPNTALNKEALKRGATWYHPNGSEPMIDEKLSKGLCSLNPKEDRACFAHHMIVSPEGELLTGRVARSLMNSKARLTYGQVQNAVDGKPESEVEPFMDDVINPLYEMGSLVQDAKTARGAIVIDSIEHEFDFDKDVKVKDVYERVKYKSNKIVEAVALLNNNLVGRLLSEDRAIFRVHDKPNKSHKLVSLVMDLNENLKDEDKIIFDLDDLTPDTPGEILKQVRASEKIGKEDKQLVEEQVLHCQQAAEYSTRNIGHHGLKLAEYVHSTSPIRRYADLITQRIMINKFKLGNDGATEQELQDLDKISNQCTTTHFLKKIAQTSAKKRFLAQYHKKDIGKIFEATVLGVSGSGVSLKIDDTIKGVMPVENMVGGKELQFDSTKGQLIRNNTMAKKVAKVKERDLWFNLITPSTPKGKRKHNKVAKELAKNIRQNEAATKVVQGQKLKVRLIEADHTSGRISFEQIPTLKQRFYFASLDLRRIKRDFIKQNPIWKQRNYEKKMKNKCDPKWVL